MDASPAAAKPGLRLEMTDKPLGNVDGADLAPRPNARCQIEAGVARPAADIEQLFSRTETGPFPCVRRVSGPQLMLEAQSQQLLAVGAEDVFPFGRSVCLRLRHALPSLDDTHCWGP